MEKPASLFYYFIEILLKQNNNTSMDRVLGWPGRTGVSERNPETVWKPWAGNTHLRHLVLLHSRIGWINVRSYGPIAPRTRLGEETPHKHNRHSSSLASIMAIIIHTIIIIIIIISFLTDDHFFIPTPSHSQTPVCFRLFFPESV